MCFSGFNSVGKYQILAKIFGVAKNLEILNLLVKNETFVVFRASNL